MQGPIEIAFHNMEPLEWAEQHIRTRIAELERIFDRMASCRVRVDKRAKPNGTSIPPVVHIEIGIPGRADIVVSHEPEVFRAESLKTVDAVFFNNTVGNCFTGPVLRQNLADFVYGGGHLEIMRRRREWFRALAESHLVLWWVPEGEIPTVEQAVERLDHLRAHGPAPRAFTFKQAFGPGGAPVA